MGTTHSGINYGIINATTDEELGSLVNANDQVEDFIVEPQTNFAVGRLKPIINNFLELVSWVRMSEEKILNLPV